MNVLAKKSCNMRVCRCVGVSVCVHVKAWQNVNVECVCAKTRMFSRACNFQNKKVCNKKKMKWKYKNRQKLKGHCKIAAWLNGFLSEDSFEKWAWLLMQ